MTASDHLSGQQFSLYRAEGSHEANAGPLPGIWWTRHPEVADGYNNRGDKDLYKLDVHPHEVEGPFHRPDPNGDYTVKNPEVRARRTKIT